MSKFGSAIDGKAVDARGHHDWEQFIRTALTARIEDDRTYMTHRIGYIVDEQTVSEAVAAHVDRAVEALAVALDPFESDVWDDLEARA